MDELEICFLLCLAWSTCLLDRLIGFYGGWVGVDRVRFRVIISSIGIIVVS